MFIKTILVFYFFHIIVILFQFYDIAPPGGGVFAFVIVFDGVSEDTSLYMFAVLRAASRPPEGVFCVKHKKDVLKFAKKDQLEFRGISQRGLAKKMNILYSALNEVLNGKRVLNPELAMMMEAALGVDAAPLLAMQNEYDMLMAERNETFMEKLKHLRRIAAVF